MIWKDVGASLKFVMRLASNLWHRRLRHSCSHSQSQLDPYLPKLRRKSFISKSNFLSAWNIQQFLPMLSVSAFSSRCMIVERVSWQHSNISFPGKHCWVRFRLFNFTWAPSARFFLSVNHPSSCDHRLSLWAARLLILWAKGSSAWPSWGSAQPCIITLISRGTMSQHAQIPGLKCT